MTPATAPNPPIESTRLSAAPDAAADEAAPETAPEVAAPDAAADATADALLAGGNVSVTTKAVNWSVYWVKPVQTESPTVCPDVQVV